MTDLSNPHATVFGCMPPEWQAALCVYYGVGKITEVYSGGWRDWNSSNFPDHMAFRAAPAPVTKPSLPDSVWRMLDARWRWITRDNAPSIELHERAPEQGRGCWHGGGNFIDITNLFPSFAPGNCDWTEAVSERPEGV